MDARRAIPAGGSHGFATGGKMSSMAAIMRHTNPSSKSIPSIALKSKRNLENTISHPV
jgi:hypothetical protein